MLENKKDVFCKDCYYRSFLPNSSNVWQVICNFPTAPQGAKYYVMAVKDSTCVNMRLDENYCGKEGRWWLKNFGKKE